MGRKLVRVPLPLFWTRPSTISFLEVIKCFCTAKTFDDLGNSIAGLDDLLIFLCNISATANRICNKFQEVCFRTN